MNVKLFQIVRKAAKKNHYQMFRALGMKSQTDYKRIEESLKNPAHIWIVRLQEFAEKNLGWSVEKFWKRYRKSVLAESSDSK